MSLRGPSPVGPAWDLPGVRLGPAWGPPGTCLEPAWAPRTGMVESICLDGTLKFQAGLWACLEIGFCQKANSLKPILKLLHSSLVRF